MDKSPAVSRAEQTRRIILQVLADTKIHSFQELETAILQKDSSLLPKENTLSAILYQMRKQNPQMKRVDKSMYQWIPDGEAPKAAPKKEPDSSSVFTAETVAAKWRALCQEVDSRLRQPDYSMSTREFKEYKRIHTLNQKIREVLGDFAVSAAKEK